MIKERKDQEIQATIEQKDQEIQECNIKFIRLKGSISPELLSPEEKQIFDQLIRDEQLANLQGANQGQPLA